MALIVPADRTPVYTNQDAWSHTYNVPVEFLWDSYIWDRLSLWLLYGTSGHLAGAVARRPLLRMTVLASDSGEERQSLDRLADELMEAPALTPDLVTRIVRQACTRLSSLSRAGKTPHLAGLAAAEAWTDVALSLVDLELPMWRPRRLVYDNEEWLCSLSRHCHVPIELDETADGQHASLPLAILLAFVDAKRLLPIREFASVPSVRQVQTEPAHVICCDNFG